MPSAHWSNRFYVPESIKSEEGTDGLRTRPKTCELQQNLLEFMDEHVYPAEAEAHASAGWQLPPIVGELCAGARRRGLWNLFLPGEHGAGLTNLQDAPLAEITGRSPHLAPVTLNCSAPDTGNMEVLPCSGHRNRRRSGSSRYSTGVSVRPSP
jgi:acyl-CoA dehydrogenase